MTGQTFTTKIILFCTLLIAVISLDNNTTMAQTTATFGTSTSSSSSRGPIQIAGGSSTVVTTAFNQVYTATELAAAGIADGSTITELQWDLQNTNIIQGAGDASFKIYIRNSSATSATADTWGNTIAGSTLVLDRTFNTTDNFPGAKGYMAFPLTTPFNYTGGALEIAVLWDMSGVAADPAGGVQVFDNADGNNGAIKWRWSETTGENLVSKKTSSSSISSGSSLSLANEERANMQLVYTLPSSSATSETVTFGTSTSSSSSRGPVQIAGGSSTVVTTAFNQVYTATELAAAGIADGSTITELQWDLQNTNIIQGAGDASFKIYIRNSSATSATADTWGNTIAGSTLVLDRTFNTTDNFPGAKGYMAFPLTTPFDYTGDALEIAVLWDMSGVAADPAGGVQVFDNADGNDGAIKWRYSPTTGTNLVSKKTSSSSISSGSSLSLANEERANMQLVYTPPSSSVTPETVAIGAGTSSSSSRGPIQVAGGSSTVVTTAFNQVYTATELAAAGINSGSSITELQWDLQNTNIIQGAGDASFKIYIRNSTATSATADTWGNTIAGSTLVLDRTFNTTDNFPGAKGYMAFPLTTPFDYTGGALEIAVLWDMSGVAADPAGGVQVFDNADGNNGAIKWRWSETTGENLVSKKTSSSSISSGSSLSLANEERANIQIVYIPASSDFECNGTGLSADTSVDTYDLITSVLAPGADPIETPDCGHGDFGDHITQENDADLGKDVFVFHLHVDEDDDRCINFDRQRNEIKTYIESPDNLLGVLGEEVQYKWKFKLPIGFQSSARFTHIHQLKSVGASNNEDDKPQITFTTRKGVDGNPDQLELRYAEDLEQITWAQTDLTPFKGEWVEATETVTYGDWGEGTYSLEIKKVSDGSVMFSYTKDNTRMWKTDATFIRPKWGIYRSLEQAADLRDEEVLFADFCIEELSAASPCAAPPASLNAENIAATSADLSWNAVVGANAYYWELATEGTALFSGTTSNTTISVTGLSSSTSYDLKVEADCGSSNTTGYSTAYNFTTASTKLTTSSIGTGTSTSSSRGPIHQAGVGASTRYSRYFHVFTQEELFAVGLVAHSTIKELQWDITTTDIITGAGDAPFKIYIKNSSATTATEDTWTALTDGSTMVLDRTFNETNNFPGVKGWMPFTLDTPFFYEGGSLEVAVEWNWDSVAFTNDGTIKWRYSTLEEDEDVMVRALGSSGYSTNLSKSSTSKQRANMQICFEPPTCAAPTGLGVANPSINSVDLNWGAVDESDSYTWKVVAAGAGSEGTAVATGSTGTTSAEATGLSCGTEYDLYVQADCGEGDLSAFSLPYNFETLPSAVKNTITIGTGTSSSSSRGPIQQGGGTSSTRYSRFNQVFTQAELLDAGLTANSLVTELQWDLNSTDIIAGSGDAPFKVYIKNSTVTEATPIGWDELIGGLTPVVNRVFNKDNNFPGEKGWMPFTFNTPFLYTGGALEIAVEWDYGSISEPAFTGSDESNPNGKSVKWRYSNFDHNAVVRSLGSGAYPTSNLSYSTSSTLPTQRANIQIVSIPVSVTSIGGDLEYCASEDHTTLDAGTGTEYMWSNSAVSQTIEASAGAYAVTVTDSDGCTATGSVSVTENANPTPTITGGFDACIGGNFILDAGAWTSYSWSNNATTQTIISSMTSTYTVTVTDSNGCTGTDTFTNIMINTCLANAGILTSNADEICAGGDIEASATGLSNGNYLQYFFVYEQDNLGNTTLVESMTGNVEMGESDAAFSGLAVGDYLVCSYTEDQGCLPSPSPITTELDDIYDTGSIQEGCYDIECTTVNIPEAFAPDLEGEGEVQPNNSTGNNVYVVEVCGGTAPYSIDFTSSNGFGSVQDYPSENVGCIEYQITYANGVDWTLTVTDANDCSNNDVVFTSNGLPSNPPLLEITDFTTTQETCVGDKDGSITIQVEGGEDSCEDYTYDWSGPGGFSETNTDASTGNTIEDLASGTYSVTVTDCEGTTTIQSGIYISRANLGGRGGRGSGGCKTVGNEAFNEIEELTVYPNPFEERTLIQFRLAETSNVWLSVYSVDGRKVASLLEGVNIEGNTTENFSLNAEELQNGVYILELQTESGIRQYQQLVVVK